MYKEIMKIKGIVTCKSGLHIGGTKDDIGIGTKDNPIIRNVLNGQPIIPGSSLKGAMRSILEKSGYAKGNNLPCSCGDSDCIVCKLFGAHRNVRANSGVPRITFHDAHLTDKFAGYDPDRIVEMKSETMVDRRTGTASNGSLRQVERVSAGVEFNYEIDVLICDNDNKAEFEYIIKHGLRLLERRGLGGMVTRGYGQVDFGIDGENFSVEVEKICKE